MFIPEINDKAKKLATKTAALPKSFCIKIIIDNPITNKRGLLNDLSVSFLTI